MTDPQPTTTDSDSSTNLGASLEVTNPVGMKLLVNVSSIDEAYQKMRILGAHGWSSADVPPGGYKMPYAMHDRFDFSLIGARPFTMTDEHGQQLHCLEHRGEVYKRRTLEPTSRIKRAMIKYSRGARRTDEEEAKEGDDSARQYVTLISFAGNGRIINAFCKPASRAHANNDPNRPAPDGLKKQIRDLIAGIRQRHATTTRSFTEHVVVAAVDAGKKSVDELTFSQANAVLERAKEYERRITTGQRGQGQR